MARPSADTVKARHIEIKQRYARQRRKKRGQNAYNAQFAAIRLAEINRLIDHWYGERLPDDKDGRRIVEIVANHLAALRRPGDRLHDWARARTPWLTVARMDTLIAKAVNRPIRWKADTLAAQIRLTMADRTQCRITTIGAMDCDKAARTKMRKVKARAREQARRKARAMLKAITD